MCGIAGIFSAVHGTEQMRSAVERMDAALRHRGPDDSGIWTGEQAVLSHRRLSIIDLSGSARQPMTSEDNRFTISFNGEIYNYRELRAELEYEGTHFTTTSDTEVLLKLYAKEGKTCLSKLRGMFAFAIWDSLSKTGFLARDPLGIKPLYIHESDGCFAFASELHAICKGDLFRPTLDATGVRKYFETGSLPEPFTLVKEVRMLEAGQSLLWRDGKSVKHQTWQMQFGASFNGDPVQQTREALMSSVHHHFVSDVPVGIFLSGGIDSTAILAAASIAGHQQTSTFCIGTDDEDSNESAVAKRTADHFGSTHHELRLDEATASELFGSFLDHVDQPSIDGLNTFIVCALARRHEVKVVLSGLGGDELFGGYPSFQKIPQMLRLHPWLKRVPGVKTILKHGKPQHRRLADFLASSGTGAAAYKTLRGIFSKSEAAALTRWICGDQSENDQQPSDVTSPPDDTHLSTADLVSHLEITRYMRNQLLRDSDVMSMAHGLELRVPLVDRVLYDTVTRIPAEQRLQPNKKLLTDALPEIPEWVVNQSKRGFLFPFQKWLSGDWGDAMAKVCKEAPVQTPNWYQQWSVFVLRHSIRTLGIGG